MFFFVGLIYHKFYILHFLEKFTLIQFSNEMVLLLYSAQGALSFGQESWPKASAGAHRRGDKEKGPRDNAPADLLCVYF
jgi:hypothetical protein